MPSRSEARQRRLDTIPPSRLPWEGRAERADVVILAGITLSGLYGLALLPFVPTLVGSHPLLLELISGSTVATVTMGALSRVGEASLAVAVLAALPACLMFDWIYWWAGRRWGHRALELLVGRRRRSAGGTARIERLVGRFGWVGVVLAYYLPVPSVLVYAAAGLAGMRLRVFLLLDLLGALLWVIPLVALGYASGQRAVDVVHAIDHYGLILTIAAVVVVLVALQVNRRRIPHYGDPVSSDARPQAGDELVRLASADNFRDVTGPGYRTADGRPLRAGVIYRSNELQLTDEDAGALHRLGIGAIFDLREAHEVEAHPDLAVPGATWEHLGVGGIPPGTGEQITDAAHAAETMREVYARFVTDPAARTSFGTLLHRLAASTTPQLFHCTAGKDRTGWAAALLLHLAGVARPVIEADYLLTNTVSIATREKYLGLVAEHLGADRVPVFERVMVADLGYLNAARAAAGATYGGMDGYLRDGLGLDDRPRAALRDRLV